MSGDQKEAIKAEIIDDVKALVEEVNKPEHRAVKMRFFNLLVTIATFIVVAVGSLFGWSAWQKFLAVMDSPKMVLEAKRDADAKILEAKREADTKVLEAVRFADTTYETKVAHSKDFDEIRTAIRVAETDHAKMLQQLEDHGRSMVRIDTALQGIQTAINHKLIQP